MTWPYAPKQFKDTNEALIFCREVGKPIHIFIADAEDSKNDRLFKLFPTGKMEDITPSL